MRIKILYIKFMFYTNTYRSHFFVAEDYVHIQIEKDLCMKFSRRNKVES